MLVLCDLFAIFPQSSCLFINLLYKNGLSYFSDKGVCDSQIILVSDQTVTSRNCLTCAITDRCYGVHSKCVKLRSVVFYFALLGVGAVGYRFETQTGLKIFIIFITITAVKPGMSTWNLHLGESDHIMIETYTHSTVLTYRQVHAL